MEDSQAAAHEFDKQLRWRSRTLRFLTIVLALYAASTIGLICQALLERTDWSVIFPGQLLQSAVVAIVATPFLGIVYLISWALVFSICKVRALPPSRRVPYHLIAGVIPALLIIGLLTSTALDRFFPERIFKDLTGYDLPPTAAVTHYTNTSDFLESHLSIEFRASDAELRLLLGEMGFSDLKQRGKQEFSPVQLKGDYGVIEVDWDHHSAVFKYLNV